MASCKKAILLLTVTLILAQLIQFSAQPVSANIYPSTSEANIDYASVANAVDITKIRKHIEYLSSLGSRLTGYPGCNQAAEYIYDYFSQIGLSGVEYHEYNITVPVDYGANITVTETGEVFTLYPMWPNLAALVTTPPEGITGHLIYSKNCSLSSFKGKTVEGSIVLTEFNIQDAWLNAMKLGAKAVIFIQPSETNTHESALKLVTYTPISFPRFYISRKDAEALLTYLGSQVTVRSTMRWEVRTARNVLGYVRGTKYPDLHFIYSATYDSFSHVPSLAPGADEAAGIATLLEMARYFKENPPKYTVYFIAFSGTRLAAQGAKWFIHDRIINYSGTLVLGDYSPEMKTKWGANIVLWVDLGISTGSKSMLITPTWGLFTHWKALLGKYETATFPKETAALGREIQRIIKEDINFEVQYATEMGGLGQGWMYLCGDTPIACNAEAFINLGGSGVNLVTTMDNRKNWWTPLDTVENVNFDNLRSQARFTQTLLYIYANIDNFRPVWMNQWEPYFDYSGDSGRLKWCDVSGQIVEWVEEKAWYQPVPNAIVFLKDNCIVGATQIWYRQTVAQNIWIPYMTDEMGKYFIPGLDPGWRTGSYDFRAYYVNQTTGQIIYSPDRGRYMITGMIRPDGRITQFATHPLDLGAYVIFRSGSIVLFDVNDPYTNNGPVQKGGPIGISVYEARTHALPVSFGTDSYCDGRTGRSLAVIYVPPDEPIEILLFFSIDQKHPIATLVNSSRENSLGVGYRVKAGEQLVLTNTPLRYAEDLYWVNNERVVTAASRGVFTASVLLHDEAGRLIEKAKEALKNRDYLKAYVYATEAWKNEKDVYLDIRRTVEDAINTVPFIGLLLIPFAFLGERLFTRTSGLKRIISLIIIYAVPFSILWIFHPGFTLATDIILVVLSLVTIILVSPVIFILVGIIQNAIQELRRKVYGEHFAEMSRTSALLISFSYGTQHMRRRKFRTGLIVFTIILIVAGLVSFASLQPIPLLRAQPITGEATYEGILIHLDKWGMQDWWWMPGRSPSIPSGLGIKVPEIIKGMYGENVTIALRTWQYRIPHGPLYHYEIRSSKETSSAFALLGLMPEEAEVTGIDKTLISGRWFIPGERLACIIPKSMAEDLGIEEPNVKIYMMGIPLTVVGIVDEDLFMSWLDLDNEHFTPIDYRIPSPWGDHMSVKELVILPYDFAMSLGGRVQSAAIKFKDPSMIPKAAKEIFLRFQLLTVSSYEGEKLAYSAGSIFTIAGMESQVIPVTLTVLVLLSTMLGSVSERLREISIFSVVGLSPMMVGVMFLSEALTAAIVGSTIGYLTSIGMINLGSFIFKDVFLNYTSSWVITVIGFTILAVISASIYPLLKASRLVTPSLERRWKLPPPQGDRWEIPLPIFIGTDREADGFLAYVHEFMEGHMQPDSPDFTVHKLTYTEEKTEETLNRIITAEIALAPYEIGVKQTVQFIDQKAIEKERHNVILLINRTEGSISTWQLQNRIFVDQLRKQMLLWTSLLPAQKDTYIKRFQKTKNTTK